VQPVKPNERDYQPGGKWYGFMSYSVALQHYTHAVDAYQNGYWYHGNGAMWTQQQEKHNNELKNSGNFDTAYGMPTGNLTAANDQSSRGWEYQFVDGRWTQVSTGSGSTGGGGGGSHSGGGSTGPGGSGPGSGSGAGGYTPGGGG
jgi:hypothetical protein